MFTKMDLRQGYNNIRIKKGNEWKTAFSIPKDAYKPIVIFFRLTNLLATFQTIDIASFFLTIILYNSVQKRFSKYTISY